MLGLEWLTMHHATIDCPRRKVTFQKPGTKPFSLQFRQVGDRITTISALQAQHLIESGCTAYLVSAMQTKSEVKNLSSIPVVSEFTDVFHETLPGLPPEREVDLCIETKQRMEQLARKPLRVLVCFIRHAIAIAIVERISCFLFRAGYLDS